MRGRMWMWMLLVALQPLWPQATLAERLGYKATDRVLIVNADDAGLSYGTDLAVLDGLRGGLISGATIMAPTPWFPQIAAAARLNPRFDFGVHLTLTSEWEGMRWGPVLGRSAVPSLVDAQGYFHPDVQGLRAVGKVEEVEAEAKAQVQKVLDAGVDVTHLDMHMHAMALDPRFFEAYVRIARHFDLPVRFLASSDALWDQQAAMLDRAGILHTDHLILGADVQPGETLSAYWQRKLASLKPGVTELYIHVSRDHPDLRAMLGSAAFRTGWRDRVEEARLFTEEPAIRRMIEAGGIRLIHWRELRDLQRRGRK